MRRSVLQLWPKVHAFGLALVRDPHQAEDLCQEAYLRFFGMKRTVDLSRPLLPLLLTILKNLAATASHRAEALPLDEEQAGADSSPLSRAVQREEKDAVRDALDRLSPDWRAVLYLRDGLGFSYREISGVVEHSEDYVRVTLHRARQKMRELLKNHDLDERRVQ
jgi:RNA polymerase sigma-70 factor (ECF subfamily)